MSLKKEFSGDESYKDLLLVRGGPLDWDSDGKTITPLLRKAEETLDINKEKKDKDED